MIAEGLAKSVAQDLASRHISPAAVKVARMAYAEGAGDVLVYLVEREALTIPGCFTVRELLLEIKAFCQIEQSEQGLPDAR